MLGQFGSMNMQMVTSSLLIYRLTGSSGLLGTMSLANAIPMLLISLFGGAIADRVQKKMILSIGLIFSALVSLWIALALATGQLRQENGVSWWILMVTSFPQGIIMGLMLPARQSIIPEIVSKEQAMNAVALNTLGMNIMSLAAPAVAGFMIDAFDFESVYYAMTAMYLYAAVMIFFVPHHSKPAGSTGGIWHEIQEGIKYIRSEKTILFILGFALIAVVLAMPYRQLLPIFVDDILKVGATGMGVLMSVCGIGAMVGSLIMTALPNKKRGLILMSSSIISGTALLSFSFSSIWALSLAFMIFIGVGQAIRATISNALLQSYTEARYMGRVMSIFMMEWGIVSLVTFTAGLMAEAMPVQWVIGGFAIALIFLAVMAIVFIPRLRKLD